MKPNRILSTLVLSCSLALLAAPLLLPQDAGAAQWGVIKVLAGSTTNDNAITASAASNYAAVVTCTKWDEICLEVSFKYQGAASSAVSFQWDTGNDGTNFATVKMPGCSGWFAGPVANGTSTVYWNTNITGIGAGYWRLNWMTNGSAEILTNLSIKAYAKPLRRG